MGRVIGYVGQVGYCKVFGFYISDEIGIYWRIVSREVLRFYLNLFQRIILVFVMRIGYRGFREEIGRFFKIQVSDDEDLDLGVLVGIVKGGMIMSLF